jgi:hypothetical protein
MTTNFKTAPHTPKPGQTPLRALAGRRRPTPTVARVLAGAGAKRVGVAAFSSSI